MRKDPRAAGTLLRIIVEQKNHFMLNRILPSPSLAKWLSASFFLLATVAPAKFVLAVELGGDLPLKPEISEASNEPEDAMAGIKIPEGWEIQLFAAEPDVANIVAFDIDHRGRIFACESFRQNRGVTDNRAHDEKWLLADLAATTVQDRIDFHKKLLGDAAITYEQHDDRIRRLTDSNGDGKADQSHVVADGFHHLEEGTGAGVLVRGSDIYYTCIPKLWKLVDKDDDGKADQRVVLSNGYGVRVAFRGHDMHGLVIGPDGRLYFSIGDRGYHVMTKDGNLFADPASGAVFRCELDGTGLEVFATGLRNPQELAFNDVGDLFSVDNNSDSGDMARIVSILAGGDSGWRMFYQYLPDRGPFNREKIWEPFHPEQPAYIVPPITNFTDGPSGLAYYPGTGFGDQLKDKFLICDFRGGPSNSGIRSFKLDPDGAFYKLAADDQPIWTCLATDVAFGPEGALYVSDWVDGWNGLGKGRIYRLTDPAHADSEIVLETKSLLEADWETRDTEKLVVDLSHPDRRVRFEAQWQLAARGAVDSLAEIASASTGDNHDESPLSRLHAIWGLDHIARINEAKRESAIAIVRTLITDKNDFVRAAVCKSLGERDDQASITAIEPMVADASVRVRYFATVALGKLKDAAAFPAVVKLLEENDNADPALRHAGVMYLVGAVKDAAIAKLVTHKNESVRRTAVVALRRLKSGLVTEFLADKDSLVVAEAARAIHDAPIAVGMRPLAEKLDEELTDLSVIRRALNANYRLGTGDSAIRIAKFASKANAVAEMRIEALSMLAEWESPDPRDRVINDYRPLESRSVKLAASALEPEIDSLMSTDTDVRDKMIDTASRLGIKKITPELARRVVDETQAPDARAKSLIAISRLDKTFAVKLANGVKDLGVGDLSLAALQVLSRYDAQGSLEFFLKSTDSRDMRVRQLAWDVIANIDEVTAKQRLADGVRSFLQGDLAKDVHLNVVEAANGKLDDELAKQLAEHFVKQAETEPLSKWMLSIEGGDVENGKQLFFEKTELSCVRCHKVDRAGGEVGPNLTKIGKDKDRRYLLEAVCLPNAQIAKGFETAVIVDDEGTTTTGIVRTENDEIVELLLADGSQRRIDKEAIEVRRKGNSSMPADLIKHLTDRELRDLVAYLASLKVDPRETTDVE